MQFNIILFYENNIQETFVTNQDNTKNTKIVSFKYLLIFIMVDF